LLSKREEFILENIPNLLPALSARQPHLDYKILEAFLPQGVAFDSQSVKSEILEILARKTNQMNNARKWIQLLELSIKEP